MLENKKGLSAVIVSMMLVLLGIVIVGVVWVSVSGSVSKTADELDTRAKCLGLNVRPTKIDTNCDTAAGGCKITFKREPGGKAIGGVVVTIVNKDGTESRQQDDNTGLDELQIDSLDFNATHSNFIVGSVQVAPYVNDAAGVKTVCTPLSTGTIQNSRV